MKILFAASEAFPLVKTGGLGDVIYSLPRALEKEGADVRVVLPAYRQVLEQIDQFHIAGWLQVKGAGRVHEVRILETSDRHLGVPLLLVDVPTLFDRPGNPYLHPDGYNWHDNAERFTVFSRAVAQLSSRMEMLHWKPEVVHCHDWQTGLVPALMSLEAESTASIYTIHNLSYAGVFSHEEFERLELPQEWWSTHLMEFFGNFSMLKAGVIFADHVTTVSPTYAREIQTPGFGYGFDGVLRAMRHKLSGILNGIDQEVWNPATDSYLPHHYSLKHHYMAGKRRNKEALLRQMGLAPSEQDLDIPLLGFIGRLVEQKGIDLLLDALPTLFDRHDLRLVVLGSGEHHFESALRELAALYPERLLLTLGYSEELAHRIEASADIFVMPSRFEPCGLNQLYSLRYGTPPVVHAVGGLADTVVDATPENLAAGTATGFVFDHPSPEALTEALERALALYRQPPTWRKLVRTAMARDLGWTHSAREYLDLYRKVATSRRE
jgi:starch synthase